MTKETADHQRCKTSIDLEAIAAAVAAAKDGTRERLELVGSVDQGTSSSRFLVFTKLGRIAASAQMEHTQIYPEGEDKVGWHEHDPAEIWDRVRECVDAVFDVLRDEGGVDLSSSTGRLRALGVTNQRETTLAWNARTGAPYHNAVVWDDLRTTRTASDVAASCAASDPDVAKPVDALRSRTGLPLASYFAGTKVRWLLDHVPALRRDLDDDHERHHVRFGTIDTWLAWNLTGTSLNNDNDHNTGGLFVTDVTNASRWLFMDLRTLEWDATLVQTVCGRSLPTSALPTILSSSQRYGVCSDSSKLQGVPLCAILGDQQSALFGQSAFRRGQAKCTYGTGLFLMMNTADALVDSTHGLLTTVAYKLGNAAPVYALEGSVSHSGSVVQWLRDRLRVVDDAAQSETKAAAVASNDGVYFVPAFAGLFAPYWRPDARGCIVGLTASHDQRHVCRAALEATAYQARELFDAMEADAPDGTSLTELRVDGGATANGLLMQFQSDTINKNVVLPVVAETTAIGAAFAAGLAEGVWTDLDEIETLWAAERVWKPTMEDRLRRKYWRGWKKAVQRSFGWVDDEEDEHEEKD